MDETYHHFGQDLAKDPELPPDYLGMSKTELLQHIEKLCPEITPELWEQLKRLNEPAIEIQLQRPAGDSNSDLENTHLGYELEMIRIVLVYQESIKELLFGQDTTPIFFGTFELPQEDLIRRLVSMIMLSDIGKAGPELLQDGQDSPIMRIYTHVIIDGKHIQQLKRHDFESGEAGFDVFVRNMDNPQSPHYDPERYEQIVDGGNVGFAPIGLVMQIAEQVFVGKYPPDDPYHTYKKLFQVDQHTEDELAKLGFSSDKTPMQAFWTGAHLYAAEQLFKSTFRDKKEDFAFAIVGLLHHFSQGVVPKFATQVDIYRDSRVLKLIALMEFLDKADANFHRSHKRTPELVASTTFDMVRANFQNRYKESSANQLPKVTQADQAYQEVASFLEENGVFEQFFRDEAA
jgi:hypothetical protein